MKLCSTLFVLFFCLTAEAGWWWTNVSSAWVEIGQNGKPGPSVSNHITISVWIMRQIDRGSTAAVLINKEIFGTAISYELRIVTNRIQFRYSPPGGGFIHTWQDNSAAPNTNVLAHLALKFTFGQPTNLFLFVNGTNSPGTWIVADGTVPSTNLTISTLIGIGFGGTPFMGFFNDLAIWSSALSNHEISLLYNTRLKRYPVMVSPSTLIGYWPLDGWREGAQQLTDQIPFAINMHPGLNLFYGSFEGFGEMVHVNERMFSYPPNE